MAGRVIDISAVHLPSTVGALVSGERRIDETSNFAGYLTAGPYILLSRGPYELSIEYSLDAPDDAPECKFELRSHPPEVTRLGGGVLSPTGGLISETGARFTLAQDGRIGVRTYFAGRGALTIRSVTFTSRGDKRDAPDLDAFRGLQPVSDAWGFDRGFPVDRYYIAEFMAENCCDIRGKVLEVGDRQYTRRFGSSAVVSSDVLMPRQAKGSTVVADLRNAPHIPDGTYDCVIATQVLVCIDEVHLAISTIRRILRPGGVALVTLPVIQRLDNSYEWPLLWGFSDGAARFLFGKEFGDDTTIQTYGNIRSATSFLYGLSAHELTREELHHWDPDYQVIVGVRALKPNPPAGER